jgi:hypothetical protein
LRAQVGSGHGKSAVAPLTLRASAQAGSAVGLVVVSGDAQRGTAGQQLAKALILRVVDAAGNGVADAELQLAPSEGSVPDTSIHTDSLGMARVRWTLGRAAGDHALAVHLDGMSKLLKVTAVARPAAPANLSFDDAQGDGKHAKGRHLIALVTDAYGNPVPDVRLSFSSRTGNVTPSRAVSDTKGRVKVSWTLGSRPGDQSLVGSVPGTDVRGSFMVPGAASPHTPAKTASVKASPSKSAKKRS